ncbi:MAG: hypothetical protein ACYCV0_00555 [Desulfitobacteriaceae bacterium]
MAETGSGTYAACFTFLAVQKRLEQSSRRFCLITTQVQFPTA